MSGENPNYNIIEIGQNTEESPGDLRKLDVFQTLVRNHWLMVMWKIWKGVNNNNTAGGGETDYSDHKQYRQHKHQQNKNNQEKMWKKTPTAWWFPATNKRNLIWENLDIAKKGRLWKRNWISSDSSTKQWHKDKLCQSKYIQDAKKKKTTKNCKCRLCHEMKRLII